MDQALATKLKELINQGEKLVPEGGLEFSGYNAKMQSQYLVWRKNCLDAVGRLGDKGAGLKTKITNDENGPYFYQSSAQKVLEAAREALKIVESDTTVQAAPPPPKTAAQPKPEPAKEQKAAPAPPKATTKAVSNRVFVVTSDKNPLEEQISAFLHEIGLESSVFKRSAGDKGALIEFIEKHHEADFAFYLFTAEDVAGSMFELGFLLGKLGPNKICIIHQKDVQPPPSIPGIPRKEITVRLEEISLSLMKELKAAGYSVSI